MQLVHTYNVFFRLFLYFQVKFQGKTVLQVRVESNSLKLRFTVRFGRCVSFFCKIVKFCF